MDKSKKKTIIIIVAIVAVLSLVLGLYLGLPIQKTYVDYDFMGGISLQTIIKANMVNQGPIGDKIYAAVEKVDNLTNPTKEKSDIYRINNAKEGETVKVNAMTIDLLKIAKDVYDKTGGKFNPASYTLVDIWGFSAEKFNKEGEHTVPSQELIEKGKKLAKTFENITFITDGETPNENATFVVNTTKNIVYKTDKCFIDGESAKIDLGGIAKGYAVEKCYEVFKNSVASDGLVNLGGNVYTYNKVWKVGLENPFKNNEGEKGIFGVVDVKNLSISCSGVYERNYTIDGKFYHHIIDVETGAPVEIGEKSVFMAMVIGKNGAVCDAVATSLVLYKTIENAEQFVKENYKDEISGVILINKSKEYKVLGSIPFVFNEELKDFDEIK